MNSSSTAVVIGNVILLITFAISLITVGSIDAAPSNSTQPPKPLPGSQTLLTVTTNVSGGTKKPSDFTLTVSGNSPSPKSFSGSSSGTSVTLFGGRYKVIESGVRDIVLAILQNVLVPLVAAAYNVLLPINIMATLLQIRS